MGAEVESKLARLRALREKTFPDRKRRKEKSVEKAAIKKDLQGGHEDSFRPAGAIVAGARESVVRRENVGATTPNAAKGRKRGRPLRRDKTTTLTALKPWEAGGMSRRTWYRRQKGE